MGSGKLRSHATFQSLKQPKIMGGRHARRYLGTELIFAWTAKVHSLDQCVLGGSDGVHRLWDFDANNCHPLVAFRRYIKVARRGARAGRDFGADLAHWFRKSLDFLSRVSALT